MTPRTKAFAGATILLALLVSAALAVSCTASKRAGGLTDRDRASLAARVRGELQHSWRGYERYAWGHDELKPLSKAPRAVRKRVAPHDPRRLARHAP